MSKYEVDFAKLTIADVRGVLSSNVSVADWIALADKVVVGGVLHLPVSELTQVLQLVTAEFAMRVQAPSTNAQSTDTQSLDDMLQDVDGL